MKTIIWLDDIRNPYRDSKWITNYAPEFFTTISDNLSGNERKRVIWLKNYNDFTEWIETNGLPTKIAFDHDLGYEIDALPFGIKHLAYLYYFIIRKQPKIAKTGYDACHWLINYCMDNNVTLVSDFVYQTDNTVGKKNMLTLINNFKKHQRNENNG